MFYDARNQLIDFNGQATFAYDHDGRRISATAGVTTTNYLWDEFSRYGDVVLETSGVNTVAYTLANGMVLSQTNNGVTQYLLPDAQNSTRALTDTAGTITSNYDYDAFGNLQGSPTLETNYLYTGQQFDPVSELYSLRARYYDPSLGRFLSRDVYPYNYQDPFEFNRYVYVGNNPATLIDPLGHFGITGFAGRAKSSILALPAVQQLGLVVTSVHAQVYLMLAGTPAVACFIGEVGIDFALGIEFPLTDAGCGDAPTGGGWAFMNKLSNLWNDSIKKHIGNWLKKWFNFGKGVPPSQFDPSGQGPQSGLSLQELADRVVNAARNFARRANDPNDKGVTRPEVGGNAVTAAIDVDTGQVVDIRFSGQMDEQVVYDVMDNVMPNGQFPRNSIIEDNPRLPFDCGEAGVCTSIADMGSDLSRKMLVTIDPNSVDLRIMRPCANCRSWVYNITHSVVTNQNATGTLQVRINNVRVQNPSNIYP